MMSFRQIVGRLAFRIFKWCILQSDVKYEQTVGPFQPCVGTYFQFVDGNIGLIHEVTETYHGQPSKGFYEIGYKYL